MKSQTILVSILILISLCFGVVIYAATRTDALWLNQWIAPFGGQFTRLFFADFLSHVAIPSWLIYSLPDGLWMLALTMCILMIWNFRLHQKSIFWIGSAIVVGILYELFQGLHWLSGSFDIKDLCFIILGAMLPLSFVIIKIRLCKNY